MKPSLLRLEQVTLTSPTRTLCQSLSLTIASGEIWGILGPNGSGKTTLLHTLAGLHPLKEGTIFLNEKKLSHYPVKSLAQHIGLLFQEMTFPFPQTIWEYCLTSRYPHLSYFQTKNTQDTQCVVEALHTMSLSELMHQPMQTLSGGEKRRAAIAALLVQAPAIYLLDELTNHLDLRHQLIALSHFKRLAAQAGAVTLMTLHDINLAQQFCHRILLLLPDGRVLHGPTETLLTKDNLSALYEHPISTSSPESPPCWHPLYA